MTILRVILFILGFIWLISGAAHIALIAINGDPSHIGGAIMNGTLAAVAIWGGMKIYNKQKLASSKALPDEEIDIKKLITEVVPEKEISRERAYESAFSAAKNSFENANTIDDDHELGGFCHYLIHTTQSLFDLYGHTIEHADAWHLVKAAAVASQKYTEERIIGAVMLFDKIELAKEAFTMGRQPS